MRNLLFFTLLLSQACFGVTANKVWRVGSSATLPAWGPVNLADATNAVTGQLPRGNLPTLGQQLSASSGAFTTANDTPTNVTNLSVTITTTGRPVSVGLIAASASDFCMLDGSRTGVNIQGFFLIDRSGTDIAMYSIAFQTGTSDSKTMQIPCSALHHFDPVAAGTYTYKIQIHNTDAVTIVGVQHAKLLAFEL